MRIHLGCGKRNFPGWVNVDLSDYDHIHHRASIDRLVMFDDCCAELIYASHAFEYFDRAQGIQVLKEWRRVLRPGGVLRIAVPDFEALIELYRKNSKLDQILGPLFGRMEVNAGSGSVFLFHKTVYDFASLSRMLVEAGFMDVRHWNWRLVDHGVYDDCSQAYFPHMEKDTGMLLSLNLEATRCD